MLVLTNTVSGKKEAFKKENNEVTLYVCGITPYDYAHLGHGRCYVAFDVLVRVLRFLKFTVVYGRNLTDIDDKILQRADQEYGDIQYYPEITQKYIGAFHEDMKMLNCLPPTFEPRVTVMMPHIIAFIEKLIHKGHAYVADNDVYFAVDSFSAYGKLSKHKTEDLIAGQRIEPTHKKKNPLDFVLWKGTQEKIFFKSPWGYGRPGWHIECSAMVEDLFGSQVDIHGGGRDLIFPHHENEVAQSESLFGVPLARFWLHNGFVQVHEQKMSKSLGNFFTLRDIYKQFDPMVVRYYLLNHQYRAPLEFSFDDVKASEKSYKRLTRVFDVLCGDVSLEAVRTSTVVQKMLAYLYDDLNTPGLFGVLFDHLDYIQHHKDELCAVKKFLQEMLGLTLAIIPEKQVEITPEIEMLLQARETARKNQDWKKADELRDKLRELDVDVKDQKI